ncbi:MAG: acetyltransferase [Pseudomonadota bacterium]|nr:acetyltransferase [Pseudomonadota bacterium]
MFLKEKKSGDLVEILDTAAMFDPFQNEVKGRYHRGEEMPDAEQFPKAALIFPSGESLPRCWVDSGYR